MRRTVIMFLVFILTITALVIIARGAQPDANIRLVFFVDQGIIDAWSSRSAQPEGITKRRHAQQQIMKAIKTYKVSYRRRQASRAIIEDVNDIRIGQ